MPGSLYCDLCTGLPLPLYLEKLPAGSQGHADYLKVQIGTIDDEIRIAKMRLAHYVKLEQDDADAALRGRVNRDGTFMQVPVREIVDRMMNTVARLERQRTEMMRILGVGDEKNEPVEVNVSFRHGVSLEDDAVAH